MSIDEERERGREEEEGGGGVRRESKRGREAQLARQNLIRVRGIEVLEI